MRVSTITVQDMTIPRLEDTGTSYWPMRTISEALGLRWHSQAAKLQPPKYSPRVLNVRLPGEADSETQPCLGQVEFDLWLRTLNPRKISPEARSRLSILQQHFLEDAVPDVYSGSARTMSGPDAPIILSRILKWKLQQMPPSFRNDTLKQIADKFRDENGFDIIRTGKHQLRAAVTSLCEIISELEPSQASDLTVSQRVDAIIESLLQPCGRRSPVDTAGLAALVCGVELERLQRAKASDQSH